MHLIFLSFSFSRPPFHPVGTQNSIGIGPPSSALLFVICSPVGPYYPQGFKPVSLYATTEYIRAAPGGGYSILGVHATQRLS
jgi:branched-chain amino acid aminotransferase